MKREKNSNLISEIDFKLYLMRGVQRLDKPFFNKNTPIENSISKDEFGNRVILSSNFDHDKLNDFKSSSKQLEKILDKTIKNSINRNDTVGIMLSGGLDSTIIATILRQYTKNIFAYTIEFVGKQGTKESSYAKHVADTLGIKHKVIKITQKDFLENMYELLEEYENPLWCWSAVLQYIMCKEAKKDNCEQIFSGLGSDEVFGGYHNMGKYLWNIHNFKKGKSNQEKYDEILYKNDEQLFEKYFFTGGTNPFESEVLNSMFINIDHSVTKFYDLKAYYCELLKENPNAIPESIFLQLEIDFRVSNILLPDFNLASNKANIKTIYPFLCMDLLKLSSQIEVKHKYSYDKPSLLKYRPKTKAIDKYIVRYAYEDRISDHIQLRNRTTFTAPFAVWLKQEKFKQDIENQILTSSILEHYGLNKDFFKCYFDDLGKDSWKKPLQLFNLWQIALFENRK